ncbi:MAG: winged helix-turn-helix transcriptional regulator [Sphingomonadales bacterium]|nr:winged helix-turn-helix transcriptional regulator [Sphingomonadales bacterium]
MANDTPQALVLEDFLPYRLSILSNRISSAIAQTYEQRFKLTMPEWRIMAILGEYPGISAGEVGDKTAMDKVAVSRALQRLMKAGRVNRGFAEADKRRSILELSEDGHNVYAKVVPMARAYEEMLIAELNDEEHKSLLKILDKLAEIQIHIHDV